MSQNKERQYEIFICPGCKKYNSFSLSLSEELECMGGDMMLLTCNQCGAQIDLPLVAGWGYRQEKDPNFEPSSPIQQIVGLNVFLMKREDLHQAIISYDGEKLSVLLVLKEGKVANPIPFEGLKEIDFYLNTYLGYAIQDISSGRHYLQTSSDNGEILEKSYQAIKIKAKEMTKV